ncbi:hypothetical protein [Methylococcus capsulatus]|uniref:Uncharacterized protein n=1 Tax=Methylococcus capsulatus TaxID=414 RepID=A0ABZ2F2F8_METCP|nr:hypothetical protein [Methylococcus capsulatus]
MALDHAVLAYNEAATDIVDKQILLNIARAARHQPIHFTVLSSIAATYNFTFNAGATPALTGNSGGLMMPVFGGSIAENPTVSIVPVEGEAFTKRMLAPLQENKLTLLLRQGMDVDMALRLMAQEFRTFHEGEEVAYANKPSDRSGYSFFRRLVLHLSSIQDRNRLYVEPLFFTQSWKLPASAMTPEGFTALEKDYEIRFDPAANRYILSKKVAGRLMITNYDPDNLTEEERIRLNQEAENSPPNEIAVDIREHYPGGEFPVHGTFRLRSFHSILDFIGRSIAEEPEYDVPPDPRTPPVRENPVSTVGIMETESLPSDAGLTVEFDGRYYSLRPEAGHQWNLEAFRLLYQLYQMTVIDLPTFGTPSITIAK